MIESGQAVIIRKCEAARHGENNGCLCSLIGAVMILGPVYTTAFAGTPSYHLFGSPKRVRESECEPLIMEGGVDARDRSKR
jgi:hypothetical protein